MDAYAVYQLLMDYWAEAMQDDCYTIAAEGWVARPEPVFETIKSGKKKGQQKETGWACDLVPKGLIVARYFAEEQAAIDGLAADLEGVTAELAELEEEHGGEEGAFAELDKVSKAAVNARLREIKGDSEAKDEEKVLKHWVTLSDRQSALKKEIKDAETALDESARGKYAELTEEEVKRLVVADKWMASLERAVAGEVDRVTMALVARVAELAERYERPLPEVVEEVEGLEERVRGHLEAMGFAWN